MKRGSSSLTLKQVGSFDAMTFDGIFQTDFLNYESIQSLPL